VWRDVGALVGLGIPWDAALSLEPHQATAFLEGLRQAKGESAEPAEPVSEGEAT
jgi:hypothetical protein